jgi:hypothetical protein
MSVSRSGLDTTAAQKVGRAASRELTASARPSRLITFGIAASSRRRSAMRRLYPPDSSRLDTRIVPDQEEPRSLGEEMHVMIDERSHPDQTDSFTLTSFGRDNA